MAHGLNQKCSHCAAGGSCRYRLQPLWHSTSSPALFRQISHPQMAANFALIQWWIFSEGGKGLSSTVCHRILRALVCWMFKDAHGNLFIQSETTSATYAKYDSIWKWILNRQILSLTFLKQDWDLTGRNPFSLVDHLYQSDISDYF